MESGRDQSGIQFLLAAEQEAHHILSSARSAKLARLKQANDEAEKEITAYRKQLEINYALKFNENSSVSGSNVKQLEEETNVKIENLKREAARVSPDVVDMLMNYITTVKI